MQININFPSFEEAWSAEARLSDNLSLYARVPWVLASSVRDRQLVTGYSMNGFLPDGTPTRATDSFDWLTRIAVPDTSLNLRVFGSVKEAREAHVQSIISRHGRHTTPLMEISPSMPVDAYAYRTHGEIGYVRRLVELDVSRWRGTPTVSSSALCWAAPILRREFRYLSKQNQVFWQWAAWERRIRARSGILSPYQCIEAETIHPGHRHQHFLRTPPGFSAFEVSRGCHAEIPPVVTYKGSEMGDIDSGYWTVYYTEWAAKVSAWVLWDVYDSFKLWYVPRRGRADIRAVRLDFVLGCLGNEKELHELLSVIDQTDWQTAEYVHTKKGAQSREVAGELAPGDFIWYDPWKKERVSREVAWERRDNKPDMPQDQVCGFVYAEGVLPEEDPIIDECEAAPDVVRPINARGTVARGNAEIGESSTPVQSDNVSVVRGWLRDCGVPLSQLPPTWGALRSFGRELLSRPRTQLCAECQEGLCESCWTAYSADDPLNQPPEPTGEGPSGAGPSNARDDVNDDTASQYTATF